MIFVSDVGGANTQTVLFDKSDHSLNTNWQYFFTNLSDVTFLSDVWSDSAEPELLWQIVLLFIYLNSAKTVAQSSCTHP